jgi:hypothetical protein
MNTVKSASNTHGKETGIGRVLRGADVFNRLLKMNAVDTSSNKNKKRE